MITLGGAHPDGRPVFVIGLDLDDLTDMAVNGRVISFPPDAVAAAGLPAIGVALIPGRTEGDILDKIRAAGVPVGDRTTPRYTCEHQASNFMPCRICS